MNVLSWDKPKRAMTIESWKGISADSAPPGVYTPNMSDEDKMKWKAKGFGGEDPRVEIRKSFHFCKLNGKQDEIGGRKYAKYNNYGSQVCVVVRLDDTYEPNVLMSANGKIPMTFAELKQLEEGISEAVEYLKNRK